MPKLHGHPELLSRAMAAFSSIVVTRRRRPRTCRNISSIMFHARARQPREPQLVPEYVGAVEAGRYQCRRYREPDPLAAKAPTISICFRKAACTGTMSAARAPSPRSSRRSTGRPGASWCRRSSSPIRCRGAANGVDRELADLLNVFFPPLGYLTPKVQLPAIACHAPTSPARSARCGDGRLQLRPPARAAC